MAGNTECLDSTRIELAVFIRRGSFLLVRAELICVGNFLDNNVKDIVIIFYFPNSFLVKILCRRTYNHSFAV